MSCINYTCIVERVIFSSLNGLRVQISDVLKVISALSIIADSDNMIRTELFPILFLTLGKMNSGF